MIDDLVPAALLADPDARSRALITLWITILCSASGLLFIWQAPPENADGARALWVGVGVLCGNWWLLHRHRNLEWAASVVSLCLTLVLGFAAYVGAGVEDAALIWIGSGPLVAVLLVGRRFGFLVAALAAAIAVTLFVLGQTPGTFRARRPDAPYFAMLSVSTFVFIVYACARLYDMSRSAALARLRETMAELQETSDRAQLLAAQAAAAREAAEADAALKGEFFNRMMTNAKTQGQALSETRGAMARMTDAVRIVTGGVGDLRSAARGAGAGAEQVATMIQQTNEQVGVMSDAINETSASIQEMRMTLREMAKNVDALSTAAEATNTSMVEIDRSIAGVERSATQTAALADTVIRDAERGRSAVNATLRGNEGIRTASRTAGDSLRALADRITDIGEILTVIRNVAERTNLLALNASIIAAQAGEHGKGFAVVAHEIKELADQTSGSVKQIGEIVESIQRQSHSAVSALGQSERTIEDGVRLSEDADRALSEIVASARQSTAMVRDIAQATVEQAKSTSYVAREMERVAQTTTTVAHTVREQSRASEQIAVATDRLGEIMPRLQASADEQMRSGERVKQAVQQIEGMLDRLDGAQGGQSRESERILRAVGDLAEAQLEQVRSVERMQKA